MRLQEALEEIEDPRMKGKIRHSLADILMMCLIGFICGIPLIEDIVFFFETNQERLRKIVPLKNGVPDRATVYRVLAMIDDRKFEALMIRIMKPYIDKVSGVVAIDGKKARGSASGGSKGVHIVSAWADAIGLCIGQYKTEEKSNEITAIPELLDLLDLKNIIVTIDAMGCQKDICGKISEKGAEYVISLKGNQSTLHDSVRELFEGDCTDEFCKSHEITKTERKVEVDHGRIESRQCFLCTDISWLAQKGEWPGLKGVGMVISRRTVGEETSEERRYFITSLSDVELAAHSIRSHWGVENGLHWTLDTAYNEDKVRNRDGNSAQNLNLLRKLSLNALKTAPLESYKKKMTIKNRQMMCLLSDKVLESVLQHF